MAKGKNMKTTILMAAMVCGAVLIAGDASAQDRGRHGPELDFATLDLNSDGVVTLEEIEGQGAARFAAADTDGDGALSEAELSAQIQARADARASDVVTRMLERHDANGDAMLQADEMPEREGRGAARMFERVDADSDGNITNDEFTAAREAHEGRGRHGDGERRGGGHKGRGRG